MAAGLKGVEEPLPPGRVLSQREQALGALDALIQVLGPEIGPQVKGLVEGLLPQKPASPVPTTPTHAEVEARLRELYDSEKKVNKKVEEAKGRLEAARAEVVEAEEEMARADGELQRIQGQIKALLKEEEDRKERCRKEEEAGGDDMEDTALVEEGSSNEVGFREVGKRRKFARQGRFSGKRGSSGGGRLDVEEAIRHLHLFSEEDRGRCIRPFAVHSEEDLSGLSDENSGGAAKRAAP